MNLRNLLMQLPLLATLAAGTAAAQTDHGQYSGYLFAYFEDRDGSRANCEQLRFAISDNATHWKALNGNRAVIGSDTISNSGGIRDPYILRGADDRSFYIVATDMSTAHNGWKANPGIVMLRSNDLIHWSHAKINLSQLYPKSFGDAYYVWAPQAIYDGDKHKYMVYFTLRRNDASKGLVTYYAYANKDFTGFEGEPKPLFKSTHGSIDNDIILKDGVYHLFYKGAFHDNNGKETKSGIQRARSRKLTGPYKDEDTFLDKFAGTTTHVEGPQAFKLNGQDKYVLMFDLYGKHRFMYQTSDDLETFSEPRVFSKDFYPRHGSVISLTREEMLRLNRHYGEYSWTASEGNPIVRHKFSADPAAYVQGDTLWIWTGEDSDSKNGSFNMKRWCIFATTDMEHFTEYPTPLRPRDFQWADNRAYAAQMIGRDGRYYCYVSTDKTGIGVAVADRPQGPYRDAIGRPLLTKADCFASTHSWCCIDPSVFIDDDGQAWLFFGNRQLYYVKLKDNMIETDGKVKQITFDGMVFEEAPYVHKHGSHYYLTYATGNPERIAYAMADNINGPWTYKGILNQWAGNSPTNHQAIADFKGKSYFIYHNGAMQQGVLNTGGGAFNRSVCIDELHYNADGTIQPIQMTSR